MSQILYLANDKFYAELSQEYNPGDTTIYLTNVPDHVPTILVAGKGTSNETVFTVLNKTSNAITGVARLKGANVELLVQTPITCLNNEEFINQYRSYSGINWRSEWDNATEYQINDGVSYNNSSYVSLQIGTNHLPTDTDYWQVVGVQGSQGVQGLPGNDGADGLGVPAGGATGEVLKKKSNADNDTEWGIGGLTQTQIVNLIYPVGSIYISITSTNPGTLFGGTWVAWGTGRVPVGINTGDTEFDTVEETGGAKTHKHKGYGDADSGETAGDLRACIGSPYGDATRIGFIQEAAVNPNTGSAVGNFTYAVGNGNINNGKMSHYTKVVGYTSTKSNLPPYITCYMWKRTA